MAEIKADIERLRRKLAAGRRRLVWLWVFAAAALVVFVAVVTTK